MEIGSGSNGAGPAAGVTKDGGRPPERTLAQLLGYASMGLGVPQTLAPGRFDRLIGVEPDAQSRTITVLACGLRELAAAAGILALDRPRPVRWLWARVAGDALDLFLLGRALRSKPEGPTRVAAAMAGVAGVAAADVYTAVRMSRAPAQPMEEEGMPVKAAITVRRPVGEVYGFWRDFQNLPSFMYHLESVEPSGGGRSRWKAKAPIGKVKWDAEIVEDRPNELISWRSLPGARVPNSGTVRFRPAPSDQGTEIMLDMNYGAPGGPAGAFVAKLFGEEPRQQVKDDLRRFKQVMETGEVVRSDGSPEGQTARRLLKQRPAHPPTEPIGAEGSTS